MKNDLLIILAAFIGIFGAEFENDNKIGLTRTSFP